MALGIVVRTLGPLARDKHAEPPVVVVDEAGRFAVSVLGGHAAGANALAERVARALGATPVITTASEALGRPAVDLIGKRFDWKIEPGSDLRAVAAAVVRGEPVAVYQDAGDGRWYQEFGGWPEAFHDGWPETHHRAALVISDRLLHATGVPTVTYRPPTLAVGVGCRRGVPCAEIEAAVLAVFNESKVAALSVACLATASIKGDEPGLLQLAEKWGVPLRTFTLEELAAAGPVPTPSAAVRAKIGIDGVAEPAALLAAGATHLALTKQRRGRVTVAIARREQA
jgi:cobalamin biosynthesis protein CbiG